MNFDNVDFALHGTGANVCKDTDLARLFADCYQHVARYNSTAKQWYVYDGTRWVEDTDSVKVQEFAKEFYERLYKYMSSTRWNAKTDDPAGKAAQDAEQKSVGSLHKLARRKTLLEDARSVHFFRTEDLDTDPWTLNTMNFTLDLRTGECKPHSPHDLLSHVANVEYNPTADCPRFEKFISEIFSVPTPQGYEERPALVDFVQQALGYALTGSVTEDCLFIEYGATTRNGKTTLAEAILSVMGSYGCTTKPDTLAYSGKPSGNNANEDVARLKGKRFVSISEPQKAMHLDAAKVKDMTGGGTQVARFLHQNSFEFKPEFKIFIDTNYLPKASDDTLFTSGRIHVLGFERHFSEDERDRDLSAKLEEEKSGILNWLLAGLEKYLAAGHLIAPAEVIEATKEYQQENDRIGQFFEDRMEQTKGTNSKGGEVYRAYCDWCADNNSHPQSKSVFFNDLRRRGLMYPCLINGLQDKNGVAGYVIRDTTESDRWESITSMEPPPERGRI